MPRYISLNSYTQLEQTITDDLKSALERRGFSVIHNGTRDSHAPGGKPDIVAFDEEHVLIFEVTKSKSAAQDREFQSIRSHLKDVKAKNVKNSAFVFLFRLKLLNGLLIAFTIIITSGQVRVNPI
ncbi:MAG: AlwI family type II restriction endonuclease [Chloroflexi bacterium]|nr:AlwI family type II restriction endonuclease [Chloroflexota bacterium]